MHFEDNFCETFAFVSFSMEPAAAAWLTHWSRQQASMHRELEQRLHAAGSMRIAGEKRLRPTKIGAVRHVTDWKSDLVSNVPIVLLTRFTPCRVLPVLAWLYAVHECPEQRHTYIYSVD